MRSVFTRLFEPGFIGPLGIKNRIIMAPMVTHYITREGGVSDRLKEEGQRFLRALTDDPDQQGILIFGRSYNAFTRDANMGIPQKFASRGVPVIPFSFLPYEDEEIPAGTPFSAGEYVPDDLGVEGRRAAGDTVTTAGPAASCSPARVMLTLPSGSSSDRCITPDRRMSSISSSIFSRSTGTPKVES